MADDYQAEVLKAIERTPNAALISGNQRSQKNNWLTAWRSVEHAICGGIYRSAQDTMGTITVVPGLCSIFRLDVFKTLEFGLGTLVEDMDWTIQLQRRGELVTYAPDAHIYSQDPATVQGYWGQIMRWYRGTWQIIKLHRLGIQNKGIDWETRLNVSEMALCGLLALALPFILVYAAFHPHVFQYLGLAFGADQLLLFTYTLLVARREKRWDLLAYFPTFIVPRLLSYVAFLWAWYQERRSPLTQWYSVARY